IILISIMFENIEPVSISTRAAIEIRAIMQNKGIPSDYGVRIGIRGGGCGGATPMLGFDRKHTHDVMYIIQDIPVYIDKRHTLYLIGKEVDFYDGADARGFVFVDKNPDDSSE